MAKDTWRPRLSIDLTEEQYLKLQKIIPWGMRKIIYRKFTDALIKSVEDNGQRVLGAFLSGDVSHEDIMGVKRDGNNS